MRDRENILNKIIPSGDRREPKPKNYGDRSISRLADNFRPANNRETYPEEELPGHELTHYSNKRGYHSSR
jgi:hypothetical protein